MRHGLEFNGVIHDVFLSPMSGGYVLHAGGEETIVILDGETNGAMALNVDGEDVEVRYAILGEDVFLHINGRHVHVRHVDPVRRFANSDSGEANAAARAPMPGTVVRMMTQAGAAVAQGDALIVIESMKLETTIKAWRDGVVEAVHVVEGQTFERSAILVSLAEEA